MYEKIKELCEKEHISVSNIGSVINIPITKSAVSKWKYGSTPRPEILKAIADHFGVTVEYLLDGSQSNLTDSKSSTIKEQTTVTELDADDTVRFALYKEVEALTTEDKEDVLKYIAFLKHKRGL